jgi:hypothetical protein
MRISILFMLSAALLLATTAHQARIEPSPQMAGYAFNPGKIEVELLR